MDATIQLYRPSNGSEGEWFISRWCARCERERAYRADPDGGEPCSILSRTFVFAADDPDYPREWREDGPSGPRCTAFVAQGGDASLTPIDPAAVVRPLL